MTFSSRGSSFRASVAIPKRRIAAGAASPLPLAWFPILAVGPLKTCRCSNGFWSNLRA